jgi:DNA polymerase III epsilon subunit-like protein
MVGKKVIIFDTETTGLPKDWKAPVSQVNNWPRVIQLGMAVYIVDQFENPQFVEEAKFLIKPDGWTIPNEKFWIENGFSQERNEKEGVKITEALEYFVSWVNDCDYLVAHNMSFDQNVIGAEMLRYGVKAEKSIKKICTKISGTDWCAIPQANGTGIKWPTLSELHKSLFGTDFEGAHDALKDVQATANCFWDMVKRGIIKLQ